MKEVWKDVVGYEGRYQVSNFGNVKSLRYGGRDGAQNLVPKCNNSGRLWVELIVNGKKKCMLIHRLVATAFLPNPNNYPQVNHIDENPKNNRLENLEWCTGSYNVRSYYANHPDFFRNRKSTPKRKRRLDKAINQYTLDGDFIKMWPNSREIEIQNNWSAWSIQECCRGNRKKAYGYTWQYAN
jgi:hypothetical protein